MTNNKRKRIQVTNLDDCVADKTIPSLNQVALITYKNKIDAAFNSYELDLDKDGSVLQTELVDWIAFKYYNEEDYCETKKQSLRKGLYSILVKYYERICSDDSMKKQKRGTNRWRTKQEITSY